MHRGISSFAAFIINVLHNSSEFNRDVKVNTGGSAKLISYKCFVQAKLKVWKE